MSALPLTRTSVPGVYRRGSRFVVVYRLNGRQRKETAGTLAEARALKLARSADARAERRGPTLHDYALGWLDRYSGSGHDSLRDGTRKEYRRLLTTFALRYFDRELRLRDLDATRVQQFVDWLTSRPGRDGRLSDRSIANALVPLRLALDAAVADGLLAENPAASVVLPRRRGGRAWQFIERRFLSREELGRLLAETPDRWRPLIELLATTGLRISEAIGLRWSDLDLDAEPPRLRVVRAIVNGAVVAPKSPNGLRVVPLPSALAQQLHARRPADAPPDAPVFPVATDGPRVRPTFARVRSPRPSSGPSSEASPSTPCITRARRF